MFLRSAWYLRSASQVLAAPPAGLNLAAGSERGLLGGLTAAIIGLSVVLGADANATSLIIPDCTVDIIDRDDPAGWVVYVSTRYTYDVVINKEAHTAPPYGRAIDPRKWAVVELDPLGKEFGERPDRAHLALQWAREHAWNFLRNKGCGVALDRILDNNLMPGSEERIPLR